METRELEQLRFPVGHYDVPSSIDEQQIEQWIAEIESFPSDLRAAVEHLSDDELLKRYRPGGWTIRQVVHHCSDSHLNSIARFKLAITEEKPTIKPYNEAAWAELWDTTDAPISLALDLIDALHARWVYLLKGMRPNDYAREYFHPEHEMTYRVDQTIGNYAWHCRHHLAHVRSAIAFGYSN